MSHNCTLIIQLLPFWLTSSNMLYTYVNYSWRFRFKFYAYANINFSKISGHMKYLTVDVMKYIVGSFATCFAAMKLFCKRAGAIYDWIDKKYTTRHRCTDDIGCEPYRNTSAVVTLVSAIWWVSFFLFQNTHYFCNI